LFAYDVERHSVQGSNVFYFDIIIWCTQDEALHSLYSCLP
jgi:hypothetical protein